MHKSMRKTSSDIVALPVLQMFLAAHRFYTPVANGVETLGRTPQ